MSNGECVKDFSHTYDLKIAITNFLKESTLNKIIMRYEKKQENSTHSQRKTIKKSYKSEGPYGQLDKKFKAAVHNTFRISKGSTPKSTNTQMPQDADK